MIFHFFIMTKFFNITNVIFSLFLFLLKMFLTIRQWWTEINNLSSLIFSLFLKTWWVSLSLWLFCQSIIHFWGWCKMFDTTIVNILILFLIKININSSWPFYICMNILCLYTFVTAWIERVQMIFWLSTIIPILILIIFSCQSLHFLYNSLEFLNVLIFHRLWLLVAIVII